jgi:hypothetical protein
MYFYLHTKWSNPITITFHLTFFFYWSSINFPNRFKIDGKKTLEKIEWKLRSRFSDLVKGIIFNIIWKSTKKWKITNSKDFPSNCSTGKLFHCQIIWFNPDQLNSLFSKALSNKRLTFLLLMEKGNSIFHKSRMSSEGDNLTKYKIMISDRKKPDSIFYRNFLSEKIPGKC